MIFIRNISLSAPNCTPALEIVVYKFNYNEHILTYVSELGIYRSV
jgi:hypothetical protein